MPPFSVRGFKAGANGDSVTKNHTTVWIIPTGANVEREIPLQMMKQMRKTVFESEDSLDSSNASKIYRAMSDEHVARAAASRHQFGIARMIHDSLVGNLSIRQNAHSPKPSEI